jgi:conjugative transfer signal peptidase TraF
MRARALALKLLSGTALLFVIGGLMFHAGYRFNASISYPTGLYHLTEAPHEYHRGDLVLFCPPDNSVMQMALYRDYIKPGTCKGGFTPVIKKVMAVAGDTVSFGQQVRINNIPVPNARMLVSDIKGRSLPLPDTLTLAKGQFFMMSDHRPAISFDSRYYGPVQFHNLIGHIKPVFTW